MRARAVRVSVWREGVGREWGLGLEGLELVDRLCPLDAPLSTAGCRRVEGCGQTRRQPRENRIRLLQPRPAASRQRPLTRRDATAQALVRCTPCHARMQRTEGERRRSTKSRARTRGPSYMTAARTSRRAFFELSPPDFFLLVCFGPAKPPSGNITDAGTCPVGIGSQ